MTLRETEEIWFGLVLIVNTDSEYKAWWKKEKDDFSVSDTGGSEEKLRVPPTEVKPISAGPDLEIRGEGVLQKKKIGPQFGLKIRGGGSPGPLPWIRHCLWPSVALIL